MLALLVSGALLAQDNGKAIKTTKSILAFHAGPSFPLGDFKSTNLDNEQAGFAKNGFTIDLNYGYRLSEYTGIAAAVFFNKYKAHNVEIEVDMGDELPQTIALEMDNWQFYGISAGPIFTFDLGNNIFTDLRLMGGIANAKTPTIVYDDYLAAKKDWGTAPVIQGGLSLRIGTGNSLFIFGNVDYTYMKPKFQIEYLEGYEDEGPERIHQKISVLNVSGGIGFRF